MKTKRLIFIIAVILALIISVVFLTSCELINQILGNNSGGGSSSGISVAGDVNIPQGITIQGQVVIGFVAVDPINTPPVPWANFNNSVQVIGFYDGSGNNISYPFNFDNVPEGSYWLLGFIDENGNMVLDFDSSGSPTELVYGAYPIAQDGGPYLMDFSSDQSHLAVDLSDWSQQAN